MASDIVHEGRRYPIWQDLDEVVERQPDFQYYGEPFRTTDPADSPEAALKLAMAAVDDWVNANPDGSVGAVAGILDLGDGRYAGVYQEHSSPT